MISTFQTGHRTQIERTWRSEYILEVSWTSIVRSIRVQFPGDTSKIYKQGINANKLKSIMLHLGFVNFVRYNNVDLEISLCVCGPTKNNPLKISHS